MTSLIFGYGMTGQSFDRYLTKNGVKFDIYDVKHVDHPNAFSKLPSKEKLQSYEMVYISPGINILELYPNNEFEKVNFKTDLDILHSSLQISNSKDLVNITADTLSSMTNFAGVVMLPKAKKISFKHIEFLNLSKQRILVIIVTSDGSVQNRVLDTQEEYDQSILIEASNFFNEHYKDLDISKIKEKIIDELSTMKKNMTNLMSAAVELSISPKLDENLILTGQGKLLDTVDLSQNVKSIKKIIELFEKKTALLQLLEKSHHSSGMQIFIGEESGYQALDECSIVTAPYQSDGEVIGILGVIGPTRMAYERVIPIVDITAKMLSKSIK